MRTPFSALALGAVLALDLAAPSLFAQDQGQPSASASQTAPATAPQQQPHNPSRLAHRMARKLGLTSDQESALEPILADRQQQIASTRSDSSLTSRERRARLQNIKQNSDSHVVAILNDSQRQQYEQMKQDRKARRQKNTSAING